MTDLVVALRFKAFADGVGQVVDQVAAKVRGTGAASAAAARQTAQATESMAKGFGNVRTIIQTLGGAAVVHELASMADEIKEINARLNLAAGGGERYAAAQSQVFEISQRTRTALGSTAELYTKMQRATDQLGESQATALRVTELVNKTFKISGANAASADAAITQLAQGLSAGALRGDEFNSVMEQAPRLSQAIADSLHITTGQLRAQAEQGKLTADVIVKALTSQGAKIDAEFAKVPLTISGAMTQVKNAVLVSVGQIDQATGASGAVANGISAIAGQIVAVTPKIVAAGAVWRDVLVKAPQDADAEIGQFVDKTKQEMQDYGDVIRRAAAELMILPQTLRTVTGVVIAEADKLQIGVVERLGQISLGAQGVWLTIEQSAHLLGLKIEEVIGAGLDAVLTKYASTIQSIATLAQRVGATDTAAQLQSVAGAILASATAEDAVRAKVDATNAAYTARRRELSQQAVALGKVADSQRQAADDAAQGFLNEHAAALQQLDVTNKLTAASTAHGKAAAAASAQTAQQASAAKDALGKLYDITTKLRGETGGPLAKAEADHVARLREIAEAGGKAVEAKASEKEVRGAVKDAIDAENAAYERQRVIAGAAKTKIDELLDSMREELAAIGQTSDQRELSNRLRETEKALIADGRSLTEDFSKQKLAEVTALQTSIAAHQRYADQVQAARDRVRGYFNSMADALGAALTRGGNILRNLGRALVDTLSQIVTQMIQQWLRTAIIGTFLGNGSGYGAAASQALLGGGGSGGSVFSNIGTAWQAYQSGGSFWNTLIGGSRAYESASGFVGPPSSLANPYGGTVGGYSTVGLGGALAGAAYGASRGDGGLGTAASTVAGATAGYAVGAAAATAISSGVAAGLAAVPVVGWIALAALLIDKISGGKLFGTKFQTKSATQTLAIGPDGGQAFLDVYQERQRALFGGKESRTKSVDPGDDARKAVADFFKAIKQTMTDAAKALGVDVPPVIEAAIRTVNEYDKKGHVTATKYLVDAIGRTWEEASAELASKRIQAESIIATVGKSAGDAASKTAEQWRSSADTLFEGAQLLLAAQVDITKGSALLGANATLDATAKVVQQLSAAGETMLDTYSRLQGETKLLTDALRSMGVTLGKSGADLVTFADQLAQAAGGTDQAQALWAKYFANFGAAAATVTDQLAQLQSDAASKLSKIGLDGLVSLDAFNAKFKAVLPTLSPQQVEQWLEAASALADATNAQKAYNSSVQAYSDYFESIRRDIQTASGWNDGGAGAAFDQIAAWYDDAKAKATALARAMGQTAASSSDLAVIEIRLAQLRAQAEQQLRASIQSLVAQLGFGGAQTLDALQQQIAQVEATQQSATAAAQEAADASAQRYQDELASIERIRGFLKSLLLNTQLTTLTPEQQLAEAKRQYEATLAAAQGGDATALGQLTDAAQQYLTLSRGYYSSGDQYQAAFNAVTAALQALHATAPGGAAGGGGGVYTISASADLQALYEKRDAILAQQEAQTRLAMTQQLAVQLRELAAQTGEPIAQLAAEVGVRLDDFVEGLGIDLGHLTVATTEQLADLANTLGVSLTDLSASVGANLGDLADQNSLINQALGDRIRQLPATERALLEPLFNAITSATNEADANAAIERLKEATNTLPQGIKDKIGALLGLPQATVDAISGTKDSTAAIADKTYDIAENTGNVAANTFYKLPLAAIADVHTEAFVQIHSRLAEIRDVLGGHATYGLGSNAAPTDTAAFALPLSNLNVIAAAPAQSASGDDSAALRAELAALHAELKQQRADQVRTGQQIADLLEQLAGTSVDQGDKIVRALRRHPLIGAT